MNELRCELWLRGGGGGGLFFFFKQKTAYEMCGRDWSSDVCSSDLIAKVPGEGEELIL